MTTCVCALRQVSVQCLVVLAGAMSATPAPAQSRFVYTHGFPTPHEGIDEDGQPWIVTYDATTQRVSAAYAGDTGPTTAEYQLPVRFAATVSGTAQELEPGTWRYQYEVSNSALSDQGLAQFMVEIGADVFDIETPSSGGFKANLSGVLPLFPFNQWGFVRGRAYTWTSLDGAGVPQGATRVFAFRSHGMPGSVAAYALGDNNSVPEFMGGEPPAEVSEHFPGGLQKFAKASTVGPVSAE